MIRLQVVQSTDSQRGQPRMESNSHDLHYAQKNNLYLQEVTGGVSVREEKTKRKKQKQKRNCRNEKRKEKTQNKPNKTKNGEICIRSGNYSECLGFVAGNADYAAILSRRPEVAWPVMGSQTSDMTGPSCENALSH